MSLENEDQHIMDQPAEMNYESQKKLKIRYTRDFLLSLSELDVCKKLPSGFEKSLLSEFEDAPQDRPKIPGGLSLHSYRRNEYGSSPPTRGESGNYSRGIHGRWDSRSSGRSDRDSDSQSDWDSDSGRRYGNQSRRSWQGPEHDGLLGSGSFVRPSGYAAGASAPKFRANDHFQLNKSNEPYHPPRPYKAVPHSRRETNDSYNDETFGSSECTSEDRAEEERKRRASFELMRKEQHKAFEEKQRLNADKRKDEFDISTLLEDSKDDDGISSKSKQFDEPMMLPTKNKDSDKSVLPSQTPALRPLVPPGFACANLERNVGTKTVTHSHSLEVGNSELEGDILHAKGNRQLNGGFDNQEEPAEQIGLSRQLETSEKRESVELDAEKVTDNLTVGESDQEKSSSILDKLFGCASTVNGGGSNRLVEQHDGKADGTCSPHAMQSSKFARWFLEEEKKPVDDLSSGRPKDLLSLIVGGEKGGSQPSDVKAMGHASFGFPSQSPEIVDRHLASNVTSVTLENSEQLSDININKPAAVSAVLTCEDLEQSILSEISGSDETLRPPVRGLSITGTKTEQTKANIDNHASQHLLSLLQKGTGLEDVVESPSLDIISSDKPHNVEVASIHSAIHDSKEANAENVSNSGKSLTLETLFGTAFMKELQSVGAPSSGQKSSIGSARVDAPELHDGLLSSNLVGSGSGSYESNILASNQPEQIKSDRIKEHLLGFDDHRTEVDSSQFRSELGSKLGGFDRSADVRLPEEDSLITLGDPMKHLRNSSKAELLSSQAAPADITEKLAALNPAFGDERPIAGGPEGSPFLRGPYDVRERDLPFRNLHVQPSSPQLHPPQLNHVGPLFNPLDSHPANINSPMKFMGPESIMHHDPPPAHQFPSNMLRPPFHHPSTGLAGFDHPAHHHPMLQQMHMQGSFPPPHLLHGFPGAPNSNNQMAGFIQDVNPMPGFPFGHQQPNFNGLAMRPPVPEVESGNNNPGTLQRLIEMELRSGTKPIHPLATAGHNQGIHNYELDTGLGYR
ncbi:Serine-rich adhesin for platelets like [Melia azedarach]|uniref:Serine-rich adhesin for platelets like n=1 Tax=Melia azedarach TaxID=155640 RepID=A0ACC1YXG6_MELAZ|nr:Serine-rich adhesin for platelets like [Melia azedarach]